MSGGRADGGQSRSLGGLRRLSEASGPSRRSGLSPWRSGRRARAPWAEPGLRRQAVLSDRGVFTAWLLKQSARALEVARPALTARRRGAAGPSEPPRGSVRPWGAQEETLASGGPTPPLQGAVSRTGLRYAGTSLSSPGRAETHPHRKP